MDYNAINFGIDIPQVVVKLDNYKCMGDIVKEEDVVRIKIDLPGKEEVIIYSIDDDEGKYIKEKGSIIEKENNEENI